MASRTIPNINSLSIVDLLVQLKALVVIPMARGRRCAEVLSARQTHDERFRHFWARVQGLTIDYNYTLACANAAHGAIACGLY